MGMPRLRVTRGHGSGTSMYRDGVFVHRPGSLGAAAAVLGAELPRSNRVLAKYTFKSAKSVHHFDGVMSHTFKCTF